MKAIDTYFDFEPLKYEIQYILMGYTGNMQFVNMSYFPTFAIMITNGLLKSEIDLFSPTGFELLKRSVSVEFKKLAGIEPSLEEVSDSTSRFHYVVEPLSRDIRFAITAYTGFSMLHNEEQEEYNVFLKRIADCETDDDIENAIYKGIVRAKLKNDYARLFKSQQELDKIFIDQNHILSRLPIFSDSTKSTDEMLDMLNEIQKSKNKRNRN